MFARASRVAMVRARRTGRHDHLSRWSRTRPVGDAAWRDAPPRRVVRPWFSRSKRTLHVSRSAAVAMVGDVVEVGVCAAARTVEGATAVGLEVTVRIFVSLARLRERLRNERETMPDRPGLRLIRGGAARSGEGGARRRALQSAARLESGLPPSRPAVRRSRADGSARLWVIRGGREDGTDAPRAEQERARGSAASALGMRAARDRSPSRE